VACSNADGKDIPNVDDEDDSEINDEDDSGDDLYPDELFEFLPARIRYVDIKPLKLQLLPHVGFPILLRDEYDVMSTILDDSDEGIAGSCLITGQLGAGESRLLSFTSRT
jgi:hypothetical protein